MTCARCRDGIPHTFRHGYSAYRHCGCRCDICREAAKQKGRERRERNPGRDTIYKRAERARKAGIETPRAEKCKGCGIQFARPGVKFGKGDYCRDCIDVEWAGVMV